MSDPVSIILSIPGLAALLVEVLKQLNRLVKKYGRADKALEEKSLIFQDHTQKLQLEIEEFQNISPDLPQDIYAHMGKLFIMLKGKLAGFESELRSLVESGRLLRVKVVLSSIDKMLQEVDFWQRKIEDNFDLLARFPKPFKDPRIPDPKTALGRVRLINQAIFTATESTPRQLDLSGSQLPGTTEPILHSIVSITVSESKVIVERKLVDPSTPISQIEIMKKDVIDLARVLSAEDIPTRGILKCRGYLYDEVQLNSGTQKQFMLLFDVPGFLRQPHCLRDVLVDKTLTVQIRHALNERLSLAKQLARAVLHVHSKGLVHKNIRPETILLFEVDPQSMEASHHLPGNVKAFPISLGRAFLTGFEKVRKDEADTVPIGETTWAEDIYRHPSRQGPSHPEEKFNMLHDVYSLGVCLLEIAMWRSFIEIKMESGKIIKSNNSKACNLMEPPSHGLAPRVLSAQEVQRKFIRDAKNRIPIAMGERFSQIVVRCLSCVETYEKDAEQDPLLLGMRYVQSKCS